MDVLILYASRSGNTERAAEWIADVLTGSGHTVLRHDARDHRPDLLRQYPVLLLGCSTIGEGDLLPAFFPWEKDLRDLDLSGAVGAAFGTGAERYRFFAEAVTILETRLRNAGVRLLSPGLRIDTTFGMRRDQVEPWARGIARLLESAEPTSPSGESAGRSRPPSG